MDVDAMRVLIPDTPPLPTEFVLVAMSSAPRNVVYAHPDVIAWLHESLPEWFPAKKAPALALNPRQGRGGVEFLTDEECAEPKGDPAKEVGP